MSWLIENDKTGKKFKIWSTLTDSYIVDTFMDKEQVVDFISKERLIRVRKEIIDLKTTFPKGWFNKTTSSSF